MESFREQRCRTCLELFYICSCCDRGHVYCGEDCQTAARDAQVRKARRKYLTDEDVREGERQRQRDRRARVRDQGSQIVARSASVPIDATRTLMDSGGDRVATGERGYQIHRRHRDPGTHPVARGRFFALTVPRWHAHALEFAV